jgi:hypothetical protein
MPDVIAYQKTYRGQIQRRTILDGSLRIVSNIIVGNYVVNYGIKIIYSEVKDKKSYILEFLNPQLREEFLELNAERLMIEYTPLIWNDQKSDQKLHLSGVSLTQHLITCINKISKKEELDFAGLRSVKAFEHFEIQDLKNLAKDVNYIIPMEKRKPELWALTLAPLPRLKKEGFSHLQIWKALCEK